MSSAADNRIDSLQLSDAPFAQQLDRLLHVQRPRYRRLWDYYRNTLRPLTSTTAGDSDRPYHQAQEWGLPPRITGQRGYADRLDIDLRTRKEVVIENDIGWRIDTMNDYLFGKSIVIESDAPDAARREIISHLLRLIFTANGGIQFLQQLALLGSVYGFVDVLVKYDPRALDDDAPTDPTRTCCADPFGAPNRRGRLSDHDHRTTTDHPSPTPRPQEPSPPPDGATHAGPASDSTASHPAPAPSLDDPKPDPGTRLQSPDASPSSSLMDSLQRIARSIRFEIVEPARALPLLCSTDPRQVTLYAQVYSLASSSADRSPGCTSGAPSGSPRASLWKRLTRTTSALFSSTDQSHRAHEMIDIVDILTPAHWARFENGKLVAGGNNALKQIPLVHIQNVSVPFDYAGASDVEPLVPLQDELNTRLSDRASRITLQSFKMYLGKGIDDFTSQSVAPGRMWKTDNPEADIITFGGDSSAPSEELHIADVREALDKTSGVTPIAAGAIKGRIGRLTSAAALRITLLSLLAKNERKRTTYGQAIGRLCELALDWFDVMHAFPTRPDERAVTIHWPSPLPENVKEKLDEAESKLRLGIDREVVLRELGY